MKGPLAKAAFSLAILVLAAAPLGGCNKDCCPIEQPSCGCFSPGGSRQGGICSRLCDAPPVNWRRTTDESGCPVLVQDPPGGSCLSPPPRDAATDGGDAAADGQGGGAG